MLSISYDLLELNNLSQKTIVQILSILRYNNAVLNYNRFQTIEMSGFHNYITVNSYSILYHCIENKTFYQSLSQEQQRTEFSAKNISQIIIAIFFCEYQISSQDFC